MPHKYVIFVGAVRLEYEDSPVKAERILEDSGAKPAADFRLEELRGRNGPVEHAFEPADQVNIGGGEKFFRAVPRGGGRA